MSGARPDLLLAGDVGATKTNLTLYTVDTRGLSNIVPLRHCRLPPRRLPAIHLGYDSAEGHRRRPRRRTC